MPDKRDSLIKIRGNEPSTESKRQGLPKVKSTVVAKPVGDTEWKKMKIISCAGKATGKYSKHLNVLHEDTGKLECVDWDEITDWKEVPEE